MTPKDLGSAVAEDRTVRRMLVLGTWWGLVWRLILIGSPLTLGANALLSTGGTLAGTAVGSVVWLIVSLWAVRRLVRVPWPWVFAAWWALTWRLSLVGGVLFAVASWALGTAAGTAADLWVALASFLPVSLWAVRGLIVVIERKYARAVAVNA